MYTGMQNKRKRGFTLIELMVVIAVMGILAAIAVPNVFGIVERSREKIDLLKLYYLRDALNRALVEDENALYNSDYVNKDNKGGITNALKSDKGLVLFIFAAQLGVSTGNVQGSGGGFGNTMCGLIGQSSGGVWIDALREGGFEGVADIVAYRMHDNNNAYKKESFTVGKYKTWTTTFPKTPMFISESLTRTKDGKADKNGENYYGMAFRFANVDDPHSVEVYIISSNGNYKNAYRGDRGVCFSTYGDAGCN